MHKPVCTDEQLHRIIQHQREMIIKLNGQVRSLEGHNTHLKDCIITVREQTEKGYKNV